MPGHRSYSLTVSPDPSGTGVVSCVLRPRGSLADELPLREAAALAAWPDAPEVFMVANPEDNAAVVDQYRALLEDVAAAGALQARWTLRRL